MRRAFLPLQLFDEDGEFLHSVGEGFIGRCFGLATDGKVAKIIRRKRFSRERG